MVNCEDDGVDPEGEKRLGGAGGTTFTNVLLSTCP